MPYLPTPCFSGWEFVTERETHQVIADAKLHHYSHHHNPSFLASKAYDSVS